MAEYKTYTDVNGVKWTIATAARSLLATVLDDTEPRYFPPPNDLVEVVPTPDDETPAALAEVRRTAFGRLRNAIDDFAKDHKAAVGLTVKPSGGGAVVLLLLAAAIVFGDG